MTQPSATCPDCACDIPPMQGITLAFCPLCRFPLMEIAGKYKLLRKLGEGGFGIVYLARHIELPGDIYRVLKVIRHELLDQDQVLRRFRREIRVTAALSEKNEHIIRVYDDFGEAPKLGHYYVMEYLQGSTLKDYMADKAPLAPGLVFGLFHQLCEAVSVAHEHNVVHRDLKPENVFLLNADDPLPFVKVLDFGIAKSLAESQSVSAATQGALGTPLYMPPEQFFNQDIDARSDQYTLAGMLYEMLTGALPHGKWAGGQIELFTARLSEPPPSLTTFPIDHTLALAMDPVLQTALKPHPSERFDTVASMWNEIVRAAGLSLPRLDQGQSLPTNKSAGPIPTGAYEQDEEEEEALSAVTKARPSVFLADSHNQAYQGLPSADALSAAAPSPPPLDALSNDTLAPQSPSPESPAWYRIAWLALCLLLVTGGVALVVNQMGEPTPAPLPAPKRPQRATLIAKRPTPMKRKVQRRAPLPRPRARATAAKPHPRSRPRRRVLRKRPTKTKKVRKVARAIRKAAARRLTKKASPKIPLTPYYVSPSLRAFPKGVRMCNWQVYRLSFKRGGSCRTDGPRKQPTLRWRQYLQGEVRAGLIYYRRVLYVGIRRKFNVRGGGVARLRLYNGKRLRSRSLGSVMAAPYVSRRYMIVPEGKFMTRVSKRSKRIQWRAETKSFIMSSPARGGGLIFFGGNDKFFRAYDPADQGYAWEKDMGARIYASPTVAYKKVYFGTLDGLFHAFDYRGTLEWRTNKLAGPIEKTAAIYNKRVYVCAGKWLYALKSNNGDVVWKRKLPGVLKTAPTVDRSGVYVGTINGIMVSISLSGRLRWKRRTGKQISSAPFATNKTIYFGNYAGYVYALDKSTGKVRWRYKTLAPVIGSPIVVHRALFVADNSGYVYALE